MTYGSLKEFNAAISKQILNSANLLSGYLNPPNYNVRLKYLFLGINPSGSKSVETRRLNDADKFLTFGKFAKKKPFCDFKNPKKNTAQKLIYPTYFDRPASLISFDNEVRIYWQHPIQFEFIEKSNPEQKEFLKRIKDCGVIDGTDKDYYYGFFELLYVREKEQKKITKILQNNEELKKLVADLYKRQIQYYKPKNVIVINAYVSKFIIENVLKTKPCSSYYDEKQKIRYFFSGMISGQRAIDDFALLRLKAEIISDFFR